MKFYTLIFITFLTVACTPENIFQHKILKVSDFPIIKDISGQKIPLSAEGMVAFYFVDSLIVVYQHGLAEYISIHQKKTFQKLKTLLPKGRGPHEFLGFTFRGQYTKCNNKIEIYFTDTNKGNLYALNLTQSLQQDSLFVEEVAKIPYRSYPTFLTDSFFMSKAYIPDKKEVTFVLHDTNARPIHKYNLYKNINSIRYNQIGSADQIKPDLSKIAMGMLAFNQINILDLKGQHSFSITTSNSPTWLSEKYLEENDYTIYYCALKCTDDKIYALYVEQNISEWQRVEKPVELHVFNWEGTPLYKLKIKETLINFDIDEENKKLYGLATKEEIYQYDIKDYI